MSMSIQVHSAKISTAKLIFFPEKSVGKEKGRLFFQGLENDSRFSIALASLKFYKEEQKIEQKKGVVLLKILDSDGCTVIAKVNESSLRKRFGITQEEFNSAKKQYGADLTKFVSNKIKEKIEEKKNVSNLGHKGAKKADGKTPHGIGRHVGMHNEYEGHYRNGLYHGKGILTDQDGSVYQGLFKNNEPNGQGVFRYPERKNFPGYTYEGQFRNGKFHGLGTITYTNGKKYVGKFKDDDFNGRGKCTYQNGEKEKGVFVNNELTKGIKILENGDREKGIFEDEEFVKGLRIFKNGDKEKGEFKKGELFEGIRYRRGRKYSVVNGEVMKIPPAKNLKEKITRFIKKFNLFK
ncbi:MORN repeat-containing protein [Parachlamydia acanthamoebae]|nr:hypothetical protein [Parachlamydia acanthamoebae]